MEIKVLDGVVEKIRDLQIDEDLEIGFGKVMSPIMIECDYKDGQWGDIELKPYAKIELDPCTKVFHYGQEIFEGMKAYRKADADEAFLFRPFENAKRFNHSARRMGMAEFPEEGFVRCAELISAYSRRIIPRRLGESLYIRPFMIATEVGLGIAPSKEFKFIMVASPSGAYFSVPELKVFVERESCRASEGGTGSAKTGGNYAAGLMASVNCMEKGYHQVMWLDGAEKKYIEEMSGMNFFAIINSELHTPELTDTILHGITRDSILRLAEANQIKTVERKIDITEFINDVKEQRCTEAFVCGTASVIAPVHSFYDNSGELAKVKNPQGIIALGLKEKLLQIQAGLLPPPIKEWIRPIEALEV